MLVSFCLARGFGPLDAGDVVSVNPGDVAMVLPARPLDGDEATATCRITLSLERADGTPAHARPDYLHVIGDAEHVTGRLNASS